MTEGDKEYKGYNGTLVLTSTGVIIKRGLKGIILGGGHLRGDKTIPYTSIVAVQLKKAGLLAGYIQLTLKGGSEAKSGVFQAVTDENSIAFYANRNKDFEEAKEIIEGRIAETNQPGHIENPADQIEKLFNLKKKGIITEEEFESKKRQLLDV